MGMPACRKCGGKGFTGHQEKFNRYSGTPAHFILTCAKPSCGEVIGTVLHPGYLDGIEDKLNAIIKFLKIR